MSVIKKVLVGIGAVTVLSVGGCLAVTAIAVSTDPTLNSDTTTSVANDKPAKEVSDTSATKAKPAAPRDNLTSGQKNAVRMAEQYLETMPFSHDGLIEQLVTGSGYTKADATFAVNHVNPDWDAQAVKSAKNYLDTMPFSKKGLIQQLEVGSKFTHAQAVHGATIALK